jgi:hypothetical protein
MGIIHHQAALLIESIQVRSFDLGIAVEHADPIVEIVNRNEQDVRLIRSVQNNTLYNTQQPSDISFFNFHKN